MNEHHFPHWPPQVTRHLTLPQTNIFYNAEVSATRFPDKPFIVYYDTPVTFAEFRDEAERLAGFLQQECGVQAGDRVLLYMQNSPQWIIAYYGILRANAVVVPVNPMNMSAELAHYVEDSGATTIIAPQCLFDNVEPLLGNSPGQGLERAIVATYSDYLKRPSPIAVPEFVAAPRKRIERAGVTAWQDVLERRIAPGPLTAGPDDLCVMPYTSGTTGRPKGCMHTHRSVMSTLLGGCVWFGAAADGVHLSVLPFFHVTGMQGGMNSALYSGVTIVVMSRWDRDAAAFCMQRYRITAWQSISTMMVDFLSNPRLGEYDLSSLSGTRGGGAAMPDAIAKKLKALTGLDYVEGYGMTETIAGTHINPPQRPKPQCLGIPVFDVDSRVIDPVTLQEVPRGETGEIVVNAPQVMQGYWRNQKATDEAFVELDGKRFLRTGDLGHIDEDGYFFMTDRLKRMINASGYKVWPAEVEALMYRHPAIHEVCVIGVKDEKRGETVKALVVPTPARAADISAQEIIDWAHEQMAVYKAPRIVEFVASLPKSGSGKILWRKLQEEDAARTAAANAVDAGNGGATQ
ncbi:long-chain fatty acid--CoA ligase [Burkholderia sp. SRS-W-2-2016]|uniref:long-chain fatty acid--CoA ligase n=1 Tax=Burkholderia sp. SRS-W-2-2016 TaxID=1926878 RepID=UPI00094B6D86|nr:long-chain fatty acid--CoA ligase [Burkholderia sp. SRS-W-2-2016]OLL28704.1 long-chain fatty acid--CoA ligase [Burkholderia sp. SRS-W-2-2016]